MSVSPRLVDHMMLKMEEERKTLQEENESLLKRLQELSEKYQDAEHENGELRQQLATYKDDDSNGQGTKSMKNSADSDELTRENDRIQLLSQTMQKHVENLEKEKNMLYKQIENLEIENDNLRKTVNEAKNEISMWQNENQRVKGLVKQYEENLDDAGDLRGVLEDKENTLTKMSKDHATAKKKMEEEICILKEESTGSLFLFLFFPLLF